MKNPRRLPGILDVTYQTLPERELFWNLGIPGIFLSWSGNSSAFSRIRRGRFQKSSKFQKNSRSGRVWSVTSRITGKGRGFFIILYKHFLQCRGSIQYCTKCTLTVLTKCWSLWGPWTSDVFSLIVTFNSLMSVLYPSDEFGSKIDKNPQPGSWVIHSGLYNSNSFSRLQSFF